MKKKVLGKGFLLSERVTLALDLSNRKNSEERKLKLDQSLSQQILRILGNPDEAYVTLRIDTREPTMLKSPQKLYELSLTSRGVGQEAMVRNPARNISNV